MFVLGLTQSSAVLVLGERRRYTHVGALVHLTHAVDGYHANLVVEVVLIHIALVEDYLEQEGDLINVEAFELPCLEV